MFFRKLSGNCILAGSIKSIRVTANRKGDKMAFAAITNGNGETDAVFFSRVWKMARIKKIRKRLRPGKIVELRGFIPEQKRKGADPCFIVTYIRAIGM